MTIEAPQRAARDLVAIGCSAGGVEALPRILSQLPRELPAAVLIVQHLADSSPRYLVGILARSAHLPVVWAEQGARIERGRVYVAPPDLHMLVVDDHLQLARSARENHARPSIDKLFRSVAALHGSRAIGVLLTGMLHDGVAGLQAIRDAGGVVIVQDPADAMFAELPSRAVLAINPDRVLPVAAIGAAIVALAGRDVPAGSAPAVVAAEATIDRVGVVTHADMDQLGSRSTLACPECNGPLWLLGDEGVRRYRCYVGHVATARELLIARADQAESALWTAVRALDDRATVFETLTADARRVGNTRCIAAYDAQARDMRSQASIARRFLRDLGTSSSPAK